MRHLVTISRTFAVDAPSQEDAILAAFDKEALDDGLPEAKIDVKTEAQVAADKSTEQR